MWIQKADGTNLFGMNIVQGLMGIAGAKTLTEYDKEIETKDGKKVVKAFKELDNVKAKVAVQKVYDYYNGEVKEKNEIKVFFSTDGKTYAETVSGKEAKQIEYYSTKLKDSYTKEYKKAQADGDLNAEGNTESDTGEDSSPASLL
jgi:predicted hydrocarbon binding protein